MYTTTNTTARPIPNKPDLNALNFRAWTGDLEAARVAAYGGWRPFTRAGATAYTPTQCAAAHLAYLRSTGEAGVSGPAHPSPWAMARDATVGSGEYDHAFVLGVSAERKRLAALYRARADMNDGEARTVYLTLANDLDPRPR